MSQTARPLADDFPVPGERRVRAALSAAMDAAGLATSTSASDSERDRAALGLPEADRVCFVMVDGLGAENLDARSGHAPTLRSMTHFEPLVTVAPSTTAAAITAVGTGELPGKTAMMGYSLRSPASGRPFSLIKWDDPGLDPLSWQRQPTLFERLGPRARACRVVQPSAFVGSGLTLAALRGAEAVPAETLDERVEAAAGALRRGAECVYLYWGEIDHAGHAAGWTSGEWVAELESFDAAVASLARSVPRGTLVVVTADHGMVDVGTRIDLADSPRLREGADLVAGEDRAVQVYTREPEALAARWREELGESALVLTADEAVATGIFGPVEDFARSVMGDVISFQRGDCAVFDSRGRTSPPMRGVHGSLTSVEMLVPLIAEVV